jgi:hypothetical protein
VRDLTDDLCEFIKKAIKDEVEASSEYGDMESSTRSDGDRYRSFREGQLLSASHTFGDIKFDEERHTELLIYLKRDLCPGDDPDLSDASEYMRGLSEKAKAKMKEIWEAAKKRTKYEAELTRECRLGAVSESKKAYDEFMKKCMAEKKLAPPPR